MKLYLRAMLAASFVIFSMLACKGQDPEPYVPGKSEPEEPAEPEDPEPQEEGQYYFDGSYYHDLPSNDWEKEVMARTNMMKDLKWTPVGNMPKSADTPGVYYTAGVTMTGLPYSNTSGTMGYLGRDVSFYTFLSAVNNPKSKMYTVDYRTSSSYNSKSSFYGAACSNMVAYAWGLPATYLTNNVYFDEIPEVFIKKESQSIQDLNLFDIYCWSAESGGHMAMVYDIARDKDGTVKEITIFESIHPMSACTTYTPSKLTAKMKSFKFPAYFYRYNREEYYGKVELPSFGEQSAGELSYDFPTDLCVNLGDKVSIRYGTPVVINILSKDYTDIELYLGDELHEKRALDSDNDVTYTALPVGLYKARLVNGSKASGYTYFEIGDLSCGISSKGNRLTVSCSKNTSVPQYVLMNGDIRRMLYKDSDNLWHYEGSTVSSATSCTVYFAGKYGSYKGSSKTIIKQ